MSLNPGETENPHLTTIIKSFQCKKIKVKCGRGILDVNGRKQLPSSKHQTLKKEVRGGRVLDHSLESSLPNPLLLIIFPWRSPRRSTVIPAEVAQVCAHSVSQCTTKAPSLLPPVRQGCGACEYDDHDVERTHILSADNLR